MVFGNQWGAKRGDRIRGRKKILLQSMHNHTSQVCAGDSWQKEACCCLFSQLCLTRCDPHGLQHARIPCPSPSPRVCANSCPLSRWCHPTISSSVALFSSCSQSFPASVSSPMSWLFASYGQIIRTSASVLLMNIQVWFPLGWTGLIFLQSEGLKSLLQHHSLKASVLRR